MTYKLRKGTKKAYCEDSEREKLRQHLVLYKDQVEVLDKESLSNSKLVREALDRIDLQEFLGESEGDIDG